MESRARQNCGYVEVSGTFTGDICNGLNVFVAPSGYIKGSIKAGTLVIAGKVHGNVQAHSLVIHSSGELVYSKLIYRELVVEEGGVMLCANNTVADNGAPAVQPPPSQPALQPPVAATSPRPPAARQIPFSNTKVHFHSSF